MRIILAIALLALVLPCAIAVTTDKQLYIPGEMIDLETDGGPLTIVTPTGSYTLIGNDEHVSFPAWDPGRYSFIDSKGTTEVRVVPAKPLYLRTARGISTIHGIELPEGIEVAIPGFERVLLKGTTTQEIRITPNLGKRWGFERTYAVDPTVPGFGTAEITTTATGDSLYKCIEYDYLAETCNGPWRFARTLTPGQEYTISVEGADPAFGEGSAQSQPDSCTFSDEAGSGDGDSNADCLTEVQTQNAGITADLTDQEQGGGPSQIEVSFVNSLSIVSVNNANVTYRYQRVTNTQVADTSATIQVFDNGGWTTACVDTVSVGAWESFTCDLSTYITTQAEANNVQTRIQFDTGKQGQGSSSGTVYVDYSYLAMDYVYNDAFAPTYSNPTAAPASPKTYDGSSTDFGTDWVDDIAVTLVNIEHNFTGAWQNTSVTGGPTYTHAQTLGAGTYGWRQIATDAAGNWNATMPYQTYSVDKATGSIELYLNGTRDNLTIDEDEQITLTGTRAAGETSMTLTENGSTIATGTSISLPRTYSTPGTYGLTLSMASSQNYTADSETWILVVRDTTDPGPVTNLQNISAGTSWIQWSWNNPADPDLSHVIIHINGTWHANTTSTTYNITGLGADTTYEIQVRTVDDSGNIREPAVTDIGQTQISLDFSPPVISNVLSSGVQDSQATISWTTDEPADSLVRYGTSSGVYTFDSTEAADTTSHTVILTGLTPSTTYYYVVNSTDPAGNSAQSSELSFTTGPDVTAPRYGAFNASPPSGGTYPQTVTVSVDWTDNGALGTVMIEHNFTGTWQNQTMSGGPITYTYNEELAAGTYAWRSHAVDGEGNENATMPLQTYVVNRASAQVNLLINSIDGPVSVDEDVTVNITGTIQAGEGTLELLQDLGLLAQSPSSPLTNQKVFSDPGTYNITARLNQTQNYTAAQETHILTVNDTSPPAVNLVEPFDGKTDTDGEINFTFTVLDNVGTASCTLYIDGSANATTSTITDGATNWMQQTLQDGSYSWTIGCIDDADNAANSTQTHTLAVNIITEWVPTIATHSTDGTVTTAVNATGGTTTRLDAGEIVTVTAWSDAAPVNAQIVSLEASCEVDSATRGARLYYQYNTGSGWSADICPGPLDGVGTFTCDLYSQGIDTVAEINNLDVRCLIRDDNGGPSAWATLDYMQLQPDWTLIELPDFRVESLTYPSSPRENELVTLIANISNVGVVGATATTTFYDQTRAQTIGSSSQTIPAGGYWSFNTTWNAPLGSTNITVIVDDSGSVEEIDETNNQDWDWVNVSGLQTYYGLTLERWFALADGMSWQYNWTNAAVEGNIFAMDVDASSTLLNLQALTRTPGGALAIADLGEADAHLGQSSFPDSLSNTYSSGGILRRTETITVFGVPITDVPVVNSTTADSFVTGILWDVDDDTNGGYDGEEDLVFITRVNMSQAGSFGTYDYELTFPALLRADSAGADLVELFIEIT